MLKFYLLSVARDMVTDNDSSTTCRIKVKAPSLKIAFSWLWLVSITALKLERNWTKARKQATTEASENKIQWKQ